MFVDASVIFVQIFAVKIDDIVFAISVADVITAAAAAFDVAAVADVDVDVIDVLGDAVDVAITETDGTLLKYVTEPAALITFIVGAPAPIAPIAPDNTLTGKILPCPSVGGTFLPAGVTSGPPC